jgi:ABC-type Fe3+/spermidine/putrescine transport system ATPase subunit
VVKLSLVEIEKAFGTIIAVDKVSFELERREFLSLLGPSGCGKTTTLRLIAGFERPDTGQIFLDGRKLLPVPPEKRQIGFVFQNYALFPHMTVARNIAYGVRFDRRIDTQRRVEELLDLVDLRGFERRRPAELSSGQSQRVALARALAPKPKLLLLDEPLSALDAKLRESLRGEIRRIQQEIGLSAIYVTHDQEEALALSDRIGVMNEGRIEQIGTPKAIYRDPETTFVASFIGHTNRLEGIVIDYVDGRMQVRIGEVIVAAVAGNAAPGTRVTLFIKEEDLHLDGSGEKTLIAQVKRIEYRGDATVIALASSLGSLRARVAGMKEDLPGIGGRVTVGFEEKDVILIAGS